MQIRALERRRERRMEKYVWGEEKGGRGKEQKHPKERDGAGEGGRVKVQAQE
jgi:hypothetical protein